MMNQFLGVSRLVGRIWRRSLLGAAHRIERVGNFRFIGVGLTLEHVFVIK